VKKHENISRKPEAMIPFIQSKRIGIRLEVAIDDIHKYALLRFVTLLTQDAEAVILHAIGDQASHTESLRVKI